MSSYPLTIESTEQGQPIDSIKHYQIEAHRLVKTFSGSDLPAVTDVSFQLQAGEILALLGPSGCGKTTTLRMLAGFEQPDQGKIALHGKEVTHLPAQLRNIGIVFQDYALFPHMTVEQNIMFAMRSTPKIERAEKASPWLELMRLENLRHRYPSELSGGQQQRVALARTLAAEPDLVLLDEPFSNLDAALRESTRNEMRHLFKRSGTTVILVTHDQAEALSFADKIGVMQQGKLTQIGTPQQVYQHPHNAFVAQFLGHTNLLPGLVEGEYANTRLGEIHLPGLTQTAVTLSIRPEDIHLSDALDNSHPKAIIINREFRGHDYFYTLQLDDLTLSVITSRQYEYAIGQTVTIDAILYAYPLQK
ncbi:ABC transporter ATP-binding protein [Vibrio cincinnatiensis]|uniref:ABC transporter ATP-binding protein n=1 Tax=Vibrio cincinnatiensis TaxID=675 RepID=UPI001EDF2CF4|nr:ABC transporter ATP-binding protein [Vibrio cincinnatiensis]MCG3731483.1 ABC transporter ATP-binding protein [Vibrio cincinnatiensis]MCG3739178.1 ABC transporter ATP-binding protein [Vibrio cincinnatiensis]MCG3742562.1 ABC transporter ATP-binding protein [Vibrio cincinnatiensis]MCG3766257.1 ABC transporter ATP-binding protein [Vibrio cincinnatiensis]